MLRKLIKKDDRFFRLLETSAEEASRSMQVLSQLLNCPDGAPPVEACAKIRRTDKAITRELMENLCKDMPTPLDREDLEALASTLYKITKLTEKFCERLACAGKHVDNMRLSPYAPMLKDASEVITPLIKELRLLINVEKVKGMNDTLQKVEGEADNLMLSVLGDLYNHEPSPIKIMVQKDLHELVEKIFDRSRDLGNLVFHIVLKHA
jgi:uncharacterized protein Yka (UPF0111/DUF47 family)